MAAAAATRRDELKHAKESPPANQYGSNPFSSNSSRGLRRDKRASLSLPLVVGCLLLPFVLLMLLPLLLLLLLPLLLLLLPLLLWLWLLLLLLFAFASTENSTDGRKNPRKE